MTQRDDIPTINDGDEFVAGLNVPGVEPESLLTVEQQQRAEAVAIASLHVRRPSLFGGRERATDAGPLIELADYILTGCTFDAELVGDGTGQPAAVYDEAQHFHSGGLLSRTPGIPPFAHGVVGRQGPLG